MTQCTIDLASAQELADQGFNAPAIAKALGVSRNTIHLRVKKGLITIKAPRGVPMVPRGVNEAMLRDMLVRDMPLRDISAATGFQARSIIRACERFGLPRPLTVAQLMAAGRPVVQAVAPPRPRNTATAVPQPVTVDPKRAQLVDTGGRWRDLAEWAERWGVTMGRAQQEWHRLGLPLVRG